MKGEADIVIGSRFMGKSSNIPYYRKLGIKILSKMAQKLSKLGISDPLSGFRALSRKAYEIIELTENGYGIDVEMLIKAKEEKLKIVEVPVTITYDSTVRTSKRSPLYQAAEIARTIIRKTIEKRPFLYLSVPGIIVLCTGIYFALKLIELFNKARYFSIPTALVVLGFTLMGMILLTTSLIIYIIVDIIRNRS